MANYSYVAKDRSGTELTGFLTGSSDDEIIQRLHQQGLAVMHVAEDRRGQAAAAWKAQAASWNVRRASTRDLALFSRQLATVLESGIPLVKGLRGLSADSGRGPVAKAVGDLATRVERGESISDAMAAHPAVFNSMYLSMIRAGERAGTLDKIVVELSNYLEKVDDIKGKVKSAMMYPVFILTFTVLATLFLILKIVPTFSDIYKELGQDLPALTRVVLSISDVVRANAVLVLGGMAALVVAVFAALRTRRGLRTWHAMQLRMPIFGPIVTKSVMSRFARTFGILIGSGLPILESLDLVKGAADNLVVADAIDEVKAKVAAGQGVTESFRATGAFPEMILQLMATGEEAGELDTMLNKSSDFYDRQVEATVHGLSSLIEPIMIVIVGGIIGFIVLSMFLPIFGMGDAMIKGSAAM
ncbi:MAG: type II secretion system F family protein [bacterium]|nr:type II secretion system F family protein [bacterium]